MNNDVQAKKTASSNESPLTHTSSTPERPPPTESEGQNVVGFLLIFAGIISVFASFFIESDMTYVARLGGFASILIGVKVLQSNAKVSG